MYKCIKSFDVPQCNDDGFTLENQDSFIKVGSIWNFQEEKEYRFIGGEVRLEHENGTWIEITKEDLNLCFSEVADSIIIEAKLNIEAPTKYDYKHFDVVFNDNTVKTFNYYKNNPIPTEIEMIGLTWSELLKLCKKKWYEVIKG